MISPTNYGKLHYRLWRWAGNNWQNDYNTRIYYWPRFLRGDYVEVEIVPMMVNGFINDRCMLHMDLSDPRGIWTS